MITTGIIKQINISSGNNTDNAYLVELPLFKIPGDDNVANYTYVTNCALPGGLYSSYSVGDKVYVGFLHNKFSNPVILGKIYQGNTDEVRTFANLDALKITNSTQLSKNTTIGDIKYSELEYLFRANTHLQDGYIVVGSADGYPASSDVKLSDIVNQLNRIESLLTDIQEQLNN